MIEIDQALQLSGLRNRIQRLWEVSGHKILALEQSYDLAMGAPVFTVEGKYTSRGWTEWTQGFMYGSGILQYDATGEASFLERFRDATRANMAHHLTHFGVHDHGFNNISTYGNLLRLAREGRFEASSWELDFYRLALKVSGVVQARRWTDLPDGRGFVYSFNGPHSLFADTIRSMRSLAVSYLLGQQLLGENDERVSLLDRLIQHAQTTAEYTVYHGEGRDAYDVRGRVAHESIFNLNDGRYRCPNTQQGYSPFSTWTRGLSWIILGYAELLEFFEAHKASLEGESLARFGGFDAITRFMEEACRATCDFYISETPTDGIPYWDTSAPHLRELGDYLEKPADPYNSWEPVDSSAAAISAQGLLRCGRLLRERGQTDAGDRYWQGGLTIVQTLLEEPYLDISDTHQGLLRHSLYHRPNGWDHVPEGQKIPCGESSMWGDYHMRELALYLKAVDENKPYLTFFAVR